LDPNVLRPTNLPRILKVMMNSRQGLPNESRYSISISVHLATDWLPTPIWKTLAPYLTNRSRMRSFKENNRRFQIQSLRRDSFHVCASDEFLKRYQVADQLSDNPSNGQPSVFNGIR